MAIPLPTTTVSVSGVRPDSPADPLSQGYPGDASPVPTVLFTGVRACISGPSILRGQRGSGNDGMQEEVWSLRCDPTDIHPADTVTDETTGKTYAVLTVGQSSPVLFGLEHTLATLRIRRGLPS